MRHNAEIVVFDLETAGLVPAKNPLLEIGLINLNWKLEEVKRYNSIIAPYDKGNWEKEYPFGKYESKALEVNKLTMKEIQSGKKSDIVLNEVIEIFKDCKKRSGKRPICAGHNIISFDIPYLANFFARHKKDLFDFVEKDVCIDTMWWGRLKYEESTNYQLGTCCSNEGIDLLGEKSHTALGDVESNTELVKIYLRGLRGESQGGGAAVRQTRFRDTFKF